jgi:multidrug efflux system membrane fusion protein
MKIHFPNRRSRPGTPPGIALLTLLAAALLFSSCSRKGGGKGEERERPPVPVVVAKAIAQDVPVEIKAIGNVQANSTVAIRSQMTGPIMQVHFQEGQDVKAGDLLITLDPRPWEALLNQVQANAKRDEALLVSSRLEFERTKRLFESKIASRDDYDKAEAAFHSLEATLLADSAAVSNAQVSLGYTSIRSPIDGRTGSLNVKAGNVVKETDDVLVTVNQVHPIEVVFSVPEQQLPAIRRRSSEAPLPVSALAAGEEKPVRGELSFVNNTVDTTTGMIQLKARFSNEENTLWPGQFVQVTVGLSNLVQATTVPSEAVQTSQTGDFVFVVKADSTARRGR